MPNISMPRPYKDLDDDELARRHAAAESSRLAEVNRFNQYFDTHHGRAFDHNVAAQIGNARDDFTRLRNGLAAEMRKRRELASSPREMDQRQQARPLEELGDAPEELRGEPHGVDIGALARGLGREGFRLVAGERGSELMRHAAGGVAEVAGIAGRRVANGARLAGEAARDIGRIIGRNIAAVPGRVSSAASGIASGVAGAARDIGRTMGRNRETSRAAPEEMELEELDSLRGAEAAVASAEVPPVEPNPIHGNIPREEAPQRSGFRRLMRQGIGHAKEIKGDISALKGFGDVAKSGAEVGMGISKLSSGNGRGSTVGNIVGGALGGLVAGLGTYAAYRALNSPEKRSALRAENNFNNEAALQDYRRNIGGMRQAPAQDQPQDQLAPQRVNRPRQLIDDRDEDQIRREREYLGIFWN